jgi:arylsulfatase A-like enzyme/dienelactone hydrolase
MMRWWFILGLLFLLTPSPAPAQQKAKKLNIIFILADDLGYGDLGCHGHPHIKTPNIDKLAQQGMRFTQFYTTSPVCTPSRVSFMTGKHPQRFNVHHADLPETHPRYPLPSTAVTLNKLLQALGFVTAHIGKWHLGEPPHTAWPRRHGYDHFFGCFGGRPSSSWNQFARYDDAQFFLNEQPAKTYPGYATDVLTDHALQFLNEASKKDQPFYLNLWHHSPHEPLSAKVKQADDYKTFDKKQQVYYGSVANLDHNIGRLLKKLDDLGIADHTLVIFSSDNGPEVHAALYSAGLAGILRGMKTQLWEGGVRVPFIARLPGTIPAGKTTDAVGSALDFLPTLCELTGAKVPVKEQRDEGISLVSILQGKAPPGPRTLYWEWHQGQRGGPPSGNLAIRDGDWKLHLYSKENKKLLFDLAKDPAEKTDLAENHPDIAGRLEKMLRTWNDGLPQETAQRKQQPTPKTEAEANFLPPPEEKVLPKAQVYRDHQDLLYYLEGTKKHEVKSPKDWAIRKQHTLSAMQEVMGPLPDKSFRLPMDVKVVDEVKVGNLVRRHIHYQTDIHGRVPAYLFLPQGDVKRRPAVLCLHQTAKLGKGEPSGLGGNASMHYGLHLAQRGFVVLAPDYPSFGSHAWKFDAKTGYASGTMKAIWDNIRAIDLLQSLPEVDPARIGCLGHSLGGHNAMFTAAFEDRLKAIVSSCGFTRFDKDDMPSWTGPTYMPRIAKVFANRADKVPFDFQEVIGCFSPRPFLACAAIKDDDFDVGGVKDCISSARKVYELFGKADHLQAYYPDTVHAFPDDARKVAYDFLEKHLGR